jgi:large subunit ribosomal protein L30
MADARMLKVTLTRSPIGCTDRKRETLRGLGLTRVGKTVIVRDNEANQGRIRAVQHLVVVRS